VRYKISTDWTDWITFSMLLTPVITVLILMQIYLAKDLEDTLIIIVGGAITIAVCCLLLPIIRGDK
jgi:hypothetical protein